MFMKGQIVKSPGGSVYGVVLHHPKSNIDEVIVQVISGPASGVSGRVYAHTLELIGNNYQPKTNATAR